MQWHQWILKIGLCFPADLHRQTVQHWRRLLSGCGTDVGSWPWSACLHVNTTGLAILASQSWLADSNLLKCKCSDSQSGSLHRKRSNKPEKGERRGELVQCTLHLIHFRVSYMFHYWDCTAKGKLSGGSVNDLTESAGYFILPGGKRVREGFNQLLLSKNHHQSVNYWFGQYSGFAVALEAVYYLNTKLQLLHFSIFKLDWYF